MIALFDAQQAAIVRAREAAKVGRQQAQEATLDGYRSWRKQTNLERYVRVLCVLLLLLCISALRVAHQLFLSLVGCGCTGNRTGTAARSTG